MSTDKEWYPKAIRLPITTKEYFTERTVPLVSVCNHITDGTDSRNYLQNVANDSSVHFLIRDEGGQEAVVYQFMPTTWAAWGNGRYSTGNPFMPQWIRHMIVDKVNINMATVSIEHERKWPFTTPMSETMTLATMQLHRWLLRSYPTIIPDRDHIIGHYQIDHVSRANCPGGPGGKLFPFERIVNDLRAPAQPPQQAIVFPETGVAVAPDFYDYWQRNGGLPIFGYPIKPETQMTVDGTTYPVQSFERARLERHAEGIRLGLVEAERLRLLGLL